MRNYLNIFILLLTSSLIASGQQSTRSITNNAFTLGEKATYKVKYSAYVKVPVGEIDFEVLPKTEKVANLNCFHIVVKGGTYSFYNKIYRVKDQYETYIDQKSILPIVFIRSVQEGEFAFSEYVLFNHPKKLAKSKKRVQKIPLNTQDILSVLYYARTVDFNEAKPGDKFYFSAFLDDTTYNVGMKFAGRSTIKTDLGTFKVIKLLPLLVVGRVFKSEEEMVLYVSDDDNKIPIRIESGISVGSIKADLTGYSGLKNPMKAKQ